MKLSYWRCTVIRTFLALSCLAFLLAACGDGSKQPPPKTYDCAGPTKLVIGNKALVTTDMAMNESVAVPKGVETDLQLSVVDDAGKECDPSGIAASLDDPGFADVVKQDGGTYVLKPGKDFFDNGNAEPATTLHVSAGALARDWPIASVVDMAGTWAVTVSMLDVGQFTFVQNGRTISYPQRPDQAGSISGDQLTLNGAGLMLLGTVAPGRDHVDGHFTSGDTTGDWSADRVPN